MGFFSSLFGRSDDEEYEEEEEEQFPALHNGMTLGLETPEGQHIFTGRLSGYSAGDDTLTLERLPGALSLKVREIGSQVMIRGIADSMTQFLLKGVVQESTRVLCRVKDVKVKPLPENRQDFRLQLSVPVKMYYQVDEGLNHPEACTLVDISTGGACIESEHPHAVDEVMRLKVKLLDYAPMDFIGEIIRVVEFEPGKYRYGFLFAQLDDIKLSELTRTLYNIQVGNRAPWMRTEDGEWSSTYLS